MILDPILGPGRPAVLGAARTGRSGRFVVGYRRGCCSDAYLIAELDGMRRTVPVRLDRPLDVRLAPARVVPIELSCSELFDELAGRQPRVRASWHLPGASSPLADERWTSRGLVPAGTEPPEPFLPGYDILDAPPRDSGRRFSIEITLPVGASTLALEGPCGFATRDIEIADEAGAVPPIRFTLPEPDAGALELRLAGAPPQDPYGSTRPYFVDLWNRDGLYRRVVLSPTDSVLSRGIPPGAYRLGRTADVRCQLDVSVEPRATTRVELDAQSCNVEQVRPLL